MQAMQSETLADPLREHWAHWLGDMVVPDGRTMQIGAGLLGGADDSSGASVASPDQVVEEKHVHETGTGIELDLSTARLKLTWVGDFFKGKWQQCDAPLILHLRSVATSPRTSGVQTTSAPFPYKQETMRFVSVDVGSIGAILSIPNTPISDVIVLGSNSGPDSHDVLWQATNRSMRLTTT